MKIIINFKSNDLTHFSIIMDQSTLFKAIIVTTTNSFAVVIVSFHATVTVAAINIISFVYYFHHLNNLDQNLCYYSIYLRRTLVKWYCIILNLTRSWNFETQKQCSFAYVFASNISFCTSNSHPIYCVYESKNYLI